MFLPTAGGEIIFVHKLGGVFQPRRSLQMAGELVCVNILLYHVHWGRMNPSPHFHGNSPCLQNGCDSGFRLLVHKRAHALSQHN